MVQFPPMYVNDVVLGTLKREFPQTLDAYARHKLAAKTVLWPLKVAKPEVIRLTPEEQARFAYQLREASQEMQKLVDIEASHNKLIREFLVVGAGLQKKYKWLLSCVDSDRAEKAARQARPSEPAQGPIDSCRALDGIENKTIVTVLQEHANTLRSAAEPVGTTNAHADTKLDSVLEAAAHEAERIAGNAIAPEVTKQEKKDDAVATPLIRITVAPEASKQVEVNAASTPLVGNTVDPKVTKQVEKVASSVTPLLNKTAAPEVTENVEVNASPILLGKASDAETTKQAEKSDIGAVSANTIAVAAEVTKQGERFNAATTPDKKDAVANPVITEKKTTEAKRADPVAVKSHSEPNMTQPKTKHAPRISAEFRKFVAFMLAKKNADPKGELSVAIVEHSAPQRKQRSARPSVKAIFKGIKAAEAIQARAEVEKARDVVTSECMEPTACDKNEEASSAKTEEHVVVDKVEDVVMPEAEERKEVDEVKDVVQPQTEEQKGADEVMDVITPEIEEREAPDEVKVVVTAEIKEQADANETQDAVKPETKEQTDAIKPDTKEVDAEAAVKKDVTRTGAAEPTNFFIAAENKDSEDVASMHYAEEPTPVQVHESKDTTSAPIVSNSSTETKVKVVKEKLQGKGRPSPASGSGSKNTKDRVVTVDLKDYLANLLANPVKKASKSKARAAAEGSKGDKARDSAASGATEDESFLMVEGADLSVDVKAVEKEVRAQEKATAPPVRPASRVKKDAKKVATAAAATPSSTDSSKRDTKPSSATFKATTRAINAKGDDKVPSTSAAAVQAKATTSTKMKTKQSGIPSASTSSIPNLIQANQEDTLKHLELLLRRFFVQDVESHPHRTERRICFRYPPHDLAHAHGPDESVQAGQQAVKTSSCVAAAAAVTTNKPKTLKPKKSLTRSSRIPSDAPESRLSSDSEGEHGYRRRTSTSNVWSCISSGGAQLTGAPIGVGQQGWWVSRLNPSVRTFKDTWTISFSSDFLRLLPAPRSRTGFCLSARVPCPQLAYEQ
ncbi:hypothetical protein V8E36_005047 [Tilletia maclaganii]